MPLKPTQPHTRPWRRWRRRLGQGLLAAGMLGLGLWVVAEVPRGALPAALGRLTPNGFVLLVLLNAALFTCASARWQLFIRALGNWVPLRCLIGYRLTAAALAYVTPGPQVGGEPLQVWWLTHRHAVAAEQAIAGVALDRLSEWVGNLAIVATGLALAAWRPLALPSFWSWTLTPIALGWLLPALYLLALSRGWLPLTRMIRRLWPTRATSSAAWLTRAELRAARLCREQPRALVGGLLLGAAAWGVALAEFWLLFALLGCRLAPSELLIAMALSRCAFLTPLPAGLGVLEASMALIGRILLIEPAIAIAACLLIRVRDALMALSGLGLAWAGLRRHPGCALTGTTTGAPLHER